MQILIESSRDLSLSVVLSTFVLLSGFGKKLSCYLCFVQWSFSSAQGHHHNRHLSH